MSSIIFDVKGSAPEPYEVVISTQENGNISATCNCPAGRFGNLCKHRLDILNGETKSIVSDNVDEIGTVQSWLIDSPISTHTQKISDLQKQIKKMQSEVSSAKKALSKVLQTPRS